LEKMDDEAKEDFKAELKEYFGSSVQGKKTGG
jgi:hypothetical protein